MKCGNGNRNGSGNREEHVGSRQQLKPIAASLTSRDPIAWGPTVGAAERHEASQRVIGQIVEAERVTAFATSDCQLVLLSSGHMLFSVEVASCPLPVAASLRELST